MKVSLWVFAVATLALHLSVFAQSSPVISGVIDNSFGNAIIPVGDAFWVNGTGFGDTQGTTTLTLNGQTVTPYFWSDTSVHAFMPLDTVPGTVAVRITTAAGASNTFNITVTGQPTITSISPTSGTAGTTLTITGTNFLSAPLPSPNTSFVTLSPGFQLTPTSWTDTQIVTTIPAGSPPMYSQVLVAVNGLQALSQQQFVTNPNPHVTDISPSSGSIGTQVTINGSGFSIPGIIHLVYIGGALANVVSWSDTQVVATVGGGAQSGTAYVAVTTPDGQGYVNSNTLPFTVIIPQINSLSPAAGTTGTQVTITGSNFGSTRGSGKVYFSGTLASIEAWGDTSITATVPSTAASGRVTVVNSLGASNAVLFRVQGSAAFILGNSVSSGRSAATATMLTNGQVLLVGGVANNPYGVMPSAALYDPASGTFSGTGNLTTGRSSHSATLLDSGLVLIVGGYDSSYTALSSAELYDPIAGTFSSTSNMNTTRVGPTATLLSNGKVLIAGGSDSFGDPLSTAELYDPSSGTFSAAGFMTTARAGHTATLLGTGRVLLAGGYDGSFMDSASAELYDPASGSFSPTGSLNDPRDSHTATLLNSGTVLITGGWDPTALAVTQELYDPASGTFSITGVLANNRVEHTATLLNNGTVLVAGGRDEAGVVLTSAELYDPDSGSFSVTANLNYGRISGTATLLNDQTVLVTDGQSQTTELYVPASTAPTNLVSINVSPAAAGIPLGGVQQFTAVGTFVDDSTQTLKSVTWNSSFNAVATVTNDSTNQGRAYGVSDGSTTIGACAGSICGNATLGVPSALPPSGPTIDDASPFIGSVGTQVTISGSGFGLSQGSVTFGGVTAIVTSWRDTSITTAVPAGALTGSIIVSTAAGQSNPFGFVVAPTISAVIPDHGTPGSQITISGINFEISQGFGQVMVGQQALTIVSWDDTHVVATIPQGAMSGNLAVTTNDSLTSNPVAFNVDHGGPLLQLSVSDAPLQVSLTSPQTLDWIHWGRVSATVPDRKNVVGGLISDYTTIGDTQVAASSGNIAFSWSDGSHPPFVSEANGDVETFTANGGFQIAVPADTTVKTLNVYAEVFFGRAVLQATLSDGSSSSITDQSVSDSDIGSKIYSIDFRAASPGQTLTITLSSATGSTGGVGLQAATLTPHLPTVSIVSPAPSQAFSVPATVPLNISAFQMDSVVADVKAIASDGTIFESGTSPLITNWQPAAPGHYVVSANALDSTGLSNSSQPVETDIIGSGGSILAQRADTPSSVDLSIATADWILWGPVNTGDLVINNPGDVLARKAGVAPLISEYKAIGNHFINSVTFANSVFFSDPTQNFGSAGSQLQVFGKTDGFEITVPADTTSRTLQVYAGAVSARGKLVAFLSDGSAPVVTDLSFDDPNGPDFSGFGATTVYSISYNAAASGQTLTVRYTMDFDYGSGQVSLLGAALSGDFIPSSASAPQITSTSPTSAPIDTKVTIVGTGFGASQGQGRVYFSGIAAEVVNWSDTAIDVTVPAALSSGTTVQVGLVANGSPSNVINFVVSQYRLFPATLNMLVGQARTVVVKDVNGNFVHGLQWTSSDSTIVALSDGDPPVISALAAGFVNVYAGDVALPITVYAGAALPPGVPLWSVPLGPGVTNVDGLAPAPPNDSGVSIFALDNTGTLQAVSGEGDIVWKVPDIPDPNAKVIPDFAGTALLKTAHFFVDGQGNLHSTHVVKKADPNSGLSDLYTFSEQQTGSNTFSDNSSVQTVTPHPDGPVFIQDNATVKVIDPAGAQPPSTATLDNSTTNGTPSSPQIGEMIIAGDGNAYVPYVYFEETESTSAPSTVIKHSLTHSMLLRISPDGSSAKIELRHWTFDSTCSPWTPPGQTSDVGLQCSNSGPTPSVTNNSAITNADLGAAVFTTSVLVRCSSEFYSSPLILDHATGCGDTFAHTNLTYVSQDAPGTPILDAVVFPNNTGRLEAFVPALQREDGSYIGTDTTSAVFGFSNVVGVGAGGGTLFTTPLATTPTFMTATFALSNGGFRATSTQSGSGQLGIVFTADQTGNLVSQSADTGAVYGWDDKWYATAANNLQGIDEPPVDSAFTFAAFQHGNRSSAVHGGKAAIRSVTFKKQLVLDAPGGTVKNSDNLKLQGIALNKTEIVAIAGNTPSTNSQLTLTIQDAGANGSAVFVDEHTADFIVSADGKTGTKLLGPGKPMTFKMTSAQASKTADNITLKAATNEGGAAKGNTTLGGQAFSVVSVSISMRSQRTDKVSDNDKGNDTYVTDTGQQPGQQGALGLLFIPLHTPKGVPNDNAGCSIGAEFVGTVTPPNYQGKITLRRDLIANLWRENKSDPESTPLSDDTSGDSGLLTKEVQSAKDGQGNTVGTVYDLDAPGPGQGGLFGTILRYRANFRAYAELGDWNRDEPKSAAEQASDDFFWFTRISCTAAHGAITLSPTYTSQGDNTAGGATGPQTNGVNCTPITKDLSGSCPQF